MNYRGKGGDEWGVSRVVSDVVECAGCRGSMLDTGERIASSAASVSAHHPVMRVSQEVCRYLKIKGILKKKNKNYHIN